MSVTSEPSLLVGVGVSTSAARAADPVSEAREAERLGYDFVSISDHPVGDHPSYETATLLTWLAAHTERIGLATRVLGVPFRRPAMVAKAAESVHRLSGGRVVLGLGGGYADDEIRALGAPVPSPRDKVDGLGEAIEIMRAAWTGDRVSHDGRLHPVSGLRLSPSPGAPIPIWLGTYGRRALQLTGRRADGWIPSLGHAPRQGLGEMLDRVRDASVAAGRPVDAVRPVLNVGVSLGSRSSDPDVVSGSAADVHEQLTELRRLGFTGFNVMPAGPGDAHAFAHDVLPRLR